MPFKKLPFLWKLAKKEGLTYIFAVWLSSFYFDGVARRLYSRRGGHRPYRHGFCKLVSLSDLAKKSGCLLSAHTSLRHQLGKNFEFCDAMRNSSTFCLVRTGLFYDPIICAAGRCGHIFVMLVSGIQSGKASYYFY